MHDGRFPSALAVSALFVAAGKMDSHTPLPFSLRLSPALYLSDAYYSFSSFFSPDMKLAWYLLGNVQHCLLRIMAAREGEVTSWRDRDESSLGTRYSVQHIHRTRNV